MNNAEVDRFRILTVDDEKIVSDLYRKVLSPAQKTQEPEAKLEELEARLFNKKSQDSVTPIFDLVQCGQAEEAVEVVRKAKEEGQPFAVIFLDVRMPPGPSGIWAAEHIRELDPDVEIVIVTAFSDVDPVEIAHRVQPPDKLLYVQKPFHFQEIRHFAWALSAKWYAEKQLKKVQVNLEGQIEKRTTELTKTNEQLKHKITELQLVEEALRQNEGFLQNIFNAIQDGISVLDRDFNILRVNKTMENWFSKSMPLEGKKCFQAYQGQSEICENCPVAQSLKLGVPYTEEIPLKGSNGGNGLLEVYTYPIYDDTGNIKCIVEYMRDITRRKKIEEELQHYIFHDKLTELPNRSLLVDRLGRLIERAKRKKNYLFAALILNIDRFKNINDSLGHTIGDQLLISISKRLRECLRNVDTVARLGGDEFTILLDDIKEISDATRVAERIHQEFKFPFSLKEQEVFASVSIGIAINTSGYQQPGDILRDADTAMHRAKALGKARHEIFDATMHSHAVSLLQLENDLRRAVDNQTLVLHYQPIVSLRTSKIVGFEALVRFLQPDRGLIFPNDFIRVAEETGLIVPIGKWVLQEACRQMHWWQKKFPSDSPLSINVNLSAKQLSQPDLVGQIEQTLNISGLKRGTLRLEITETVIMEKAEFVIDTLMQLKAMDVLLDIDDFGTGYSSLSYLHRFPIDALKIDRSFTSKMDVDKESLEIIKTIVTLARNLGKKVIVEGVENANQLSLLKELKCDYAQGYFFSKPVDGKSAETLLVSQQK